MTLIIKKPSTGKLVMAKGQPIAIDPYLYTNTTLLLHGDGTNGSTAIIDSSRVAGSPKTVTAFGNAQISTAQSKFGGSSIAFDGSGDYLTLGDVSNQLVLSGDFTIECFVWFNNLSTFQSICQTLWTNGGFVLFHHLSYQNKIGFWAWDYSTTIPLLVQSSSIVINTFYHVVVTRSGNTFRLFVDGVLEASAISAASITLPLQYVGSYKDPAPPFQYGLNGYIDELRITKGIARYTSNFTPPTAPFPDF